MKHCPSCNSDDIGFFPKKSIWNCQECGKEFCEEPPSPHQRLADKAAHPKAIFFSYGHDMNLELVEKFKVDLENRGHTVWFDAKDIGTWEDWRGAITRGIDQSELAIAFLSKHALRDPGVCRNEIAIALNRFGKIYPIAVEADTFDDTPVTIRHLQWPDLSQWRAIKDGQVTGIDWTRWYEARLIELIEKIEGEASHFAGESHALREVLTPASFESKFAQHIPGFVGRDWVFDAYRHWLEKQPESRLFWINAGPGVGKTAIAANMAARERSAIVASWFCDAKSPELRSPERAIRSLAYQWALRWDDYRIRLLRNLDITADTPDDRLKEVTKELNMLVAQDLIRRLIFEPLTSLIWREHKLVVVIDALDEATDEAGNNLLTDFIGSQLSSLPAWIGFVVTSRPDPEVVTRLQGFRPFEINAQGVHNRSDLLAWYDQNLATRAELASLPEDERHRLKYQLVGHSEGMMLYLKMVEEGLREKSLKVRDLDKLGIGLPGLCGYYAISFEHRFDSDYEVSVQPLIRLLVAAAGPMPEELACETLGLSLEQLNQLKIKLGSYITESSAGMNFFHKTLYDWIGSKISGRFFSDSQLGRQQLANELFKHIAATQLKRPSIELWDIKQLDLDAIHFDHIMATVFGSRHVASGFHPSIPVSHVVRRIHRFKTRWEHLAITWLPNWIENLEQFNDPNSLRLLAAYLRDFYTDKLNEVAHPINLARRALEIEKTRLPFNKINYANTLILIGDNTYHGKSEAYYSEALAILDELLNHEHEDIISITDKLGASTSNNSKKIELWRRSLNTRRKQLPLNHFEIAIRLENIANVIFEEGDIEEACLHYYEMLEMWRSYFKDTHISVGMHLSHLARKIINYFPEVSEKLLIESLPILKSATDPKELYYYLEANQSLANLLKKTGRKDEAFNYTQEAEEYSINYAKSFLGGTLSPI